MSEEHAEPTPEPKVEARPQVAAEPARGDNTIIIRMWPKTPVLYPMALVALVCSLVAHFAGSSALSDYPLQEINAPAIDNQSETEAAGESEGAMTAPAATVLPAQVAADAPTADELDSLV